MPRRRRRRRISARPNFTYFEPRRENPGDEVILKVEELEAVRLKDFQGLNQDESAKKMDISQPTFHRVLLSARKKISDALVNGKSIRIEGGDFRTSR